MTSVSSTASAQIVLYYKSCCHNASAEHSTNHAASLKSTRRANTSHFGAPTTIVLAEPGPGRNTSACLFVLRHRTPTTYGAQPAPLCARSNGHHSLLGHLGTVIVPTALQAFTWSSTFPIKANGGLTQLFSPTQS